MALSQPSDEGQIWGSLTHGSKVAPVQQQKTSALAFSGGNQPVFSPQNRARHQATTQNQASFPQCPVAARSQHLPAAPSPKRGGHTAKAWHPRLCLAPPHPAPNVLLTPSTCSPLGSCLWGSRVASSQGWQGNVHGQASPSCIPDWLLAHPRGMVSAVAAGKITNTACSCKHLAGKSRSLEAPVPDQPVLRVYATLGVYAWEHSPTHGSQPPSIPPTCFAGAHFCQVRHQGQSLSLVQSNINMRGALHAQLLATVD